MLIVPLVFLILLLFLLILFSSQLEICALLDVNFFHNLSSQVEQPFDKTKNERKNFCFITFEKEDSAKQLLKVGTTMVSGVELEVKKVIS